MNVLQGIVEDLTSTYIYAVVMCTYDMFEFDLSSGARKSSK